MDKNSKEKRCENKALRKISCYFPLATKIILILTSLKSVANNFERDLMNYYENHTPLIFPTMESNLRYQTLLKNLEKEHPL